VDDANPSKPSIPNIDPRYRPDLVKHLMQHGAAYCGACDLARDLLKEDTSD
jgi:hypothetical protein